MAKKKKITPFEEVNEEEATDTAAEETTETTEKTKRVRRERKKILLDKIDALYGKFNTDEFPEVCAKIQEVKDAIEELEKIAPKSAKKSKSVSLKRMTRFKTKAEVRAMIEELQEIEANKEE